MANRLQADLLAVFVETPRWANAGPEERLALEENLRFAEDLGAEILRVKGSNVARELARVAREKNAGRIVIGRPKRRGLPLALRGSTVTRLIERATDIDVQVVAAKKDSRGE
jgi:two-component system sensor histidine kinase KdpD